MHEILSQLSEGWVLDLGSRYGSFQADTFPFATVRADLDPTEKEPQAASSKRTRLDSLSRTARSRR